MSTALLEAPKTIPVPSWSIAELAAWAMKVMPAGESLLSNNVPWKTYEKILDLRDRERPRAKLNFDRGRLEVMTKSIGHERYAAAFEHLVLCLADAFDLPLVDCRETTVRREDVDAGFEPDVWFYVGPNATRMASAASLDFQKDPPPDLAIEIEISRSLTDRLPLYARLGVVEIWRFDGSELNIGRIDSNCRYVASEFSQFFPRIAAKQIEELALLGGSLDTMTLLRRYREWVRKLAPVLGDNAEDRP